MIEGAIATYGRCFVDGTRYHTALLLPIVEGLGADAVDTHDEAMRWRHRHVAHRLESAWEQSEVSYLWTTDDVLTPQMRVRLVTTLGPDDEFADRLAEHSKLLANRVWEDRLVPLKDKYISETPVERLQALSSHHAAQSSSIPVSGPDHLVLQGQMYGRASLTCDDASPESRRPGISPRSSPVVLGVTLNL